jgi:hypothetical protein
MRGRRRRRGRAAHDACGTLRNGTSVQTVRWRAKFARVGRPARRSASSADLGARARPALARPPRVAHARSPELARCHALRARAGRAEQSARRGRSRRPRRTGCVRTASEVTHDARAVARDAQASAGEVDRARLESSSARTPTDSGKVDHHASTVRAPADRAEPNAPRPVLGSSSRTSARCARPGSATPARGDPVTRCADVVCRRGEQRATARRARVRGPARGRAAIGEVEHADDADGRVASSAGRGRRADAQSAAGAGTSRPRRRPRRRTADVPTRTSRRTTAARTADVRHMT